MENCTGSSFVLSETMDRIYAYDSDYVEARALLHAIDEYIRTYGFCTIIDLDHFGVDISMVRNKAPWSFTSNWGWMAELPCKDVELDYSPECTTWLIWLGKPVEIGDFTPIEENKGENKMNYTDYIDYTKHTNCMNYITKPEDTPMLNNLKPLEYSIDPDKLIPNRIWFNSHDAMFFTTIQWRDGTKTTVSIPENEHATEYSGFTAALAKKMFGTTGALKSMELAVERAKEPARRKAAKREELKRARQQAHELRMKEREEIIKCEMERERIRREAQRRLHKEELNETVTKVLGNLNKALKGGKKSSDEV